MGHLAGGVQSLSREWSCSIARLGTRGWSLCHRMGSLCVGLVTVPPHGVSSCEAASEPRNKLFPACLVIGAALVPPK